MGLAIAILYKIKIITYLMMNKSPDNIKSKYGTVYP